MKKGLFTVEFSVTLFLFLLGVILLGITSRMPMSSSVTSIGGPGTFPFGVSILMTILAGIQCIRSFLEAGKAENSHTGSMEKKDVIRVLIMIAASLIYVFVVDLVGYIIATVVFLAVVLWLFGLRHKILLPVLAIVFPVVLFFLFKYVFYVQLP